MRAVIQRVSRASVSVSGDVTGSIGAGLLILLGINEEDTIEDARYLVQKISQMRIFGDEAGKMNLSVIDIRGNILVVSQFTLFGQTKKGNRPSFIKAAKPEKAIPLYDFFSKEMSEILGRKVETGVFGADMKLDLINDGPVTIIIDSQMKDL